MPELEQFIYVIRPTRLEMLTEGPTPAEQQVVSQHFDRLVELAERGQLLLAGRTQNNDASTFGIVILQAASLQAAQALMEADPAVKGGVMQAELYPFRVAVTAA